MATKRNRAWLYPHTAERNYQRMLTAYVDEFTKETSDYLKQLDLLRLDGWSDDLTAAFLYLLQIALAAGQRVTARLPEVYAQVNQFNDRQFRLVVKAGTGLEIGPSGRLPPGSVPYGNVSDPRLIRARFGVGVDVYRSEPWLAQAQTNWVASNTSLIKDLPTQHMQRIEQIVRNGVLEGESAKSIAAKIEAAGGVTKRRAELIAVDQVGKANGELTKFRQTDLGIEEYKYTTSHDERVRALHQSYDGKIFRWDSPPSDGHPGMAIRCLPYESKIEITNTVKKLWRRRHGGELTTLVLKSGKSIKATPNHPVLTNRGWMPIQEVNLGDYLVNACDETVNASEGNVETRYAHIGEIFDSVARYIRPIATTAAGLQFHGDAVNEEVETIDIEGFLPDVRYPFINQSCAELFFTRAYDALEGVNFSVDSTLAKNFLTNWRTSDSVMSGFCKLLSLVNRESSHSDEICFAAIARFNSLLVQSDADSGARDSVLLGQLQLALSSDIFCNHLINGKLFAILRRAAIVGDSKAKSAEALGKDIRIDFETAGGNSKVVTSLEGFDCVVEKGISEFVGTHVYNLETESNWYSSNNLIIHNCRCHASPIFPD